MNQYDEWGLTEKPPQVRIMELEQENKRLSEENRRLCGVLLHAEGRLIDLHDQLQSLLNLAGTKK